MKLFKKMQVVGSPGGFRSNKGVYTFLLPLYSWWSWTFCCLGGDQQWNRQFFVTESTLEYRKRFKYCRKKGEAGKNPAGVLQGESWSFTLAQAPFTVYWFLLLPSVYSLSEEASERKSNKGEHSWLNYQKP